MSKRGLPTTTRMRHDRHFVEQLASRKTRTIGRVIPVDELQPNPDQPRQRFEEIDDLVASIRRVGILEPLLVRQVDRGYLVISGERRLRAAREAGLVEVPCIVLDVDEAQVLEIALIENLQRQDLSPFEEAEGLQTLVDRFGYTHEDVSRRIGKSRTTVTESLSLTSIPAELRRSLEEGGVRTKSLLLEIVRVEDPEEQRALVSRVLDEGLTRDDLRALRRGAASGPEGAEEPSPAPAEPAEPAGDVKQRDTRSPAPGSEGGPPRHLTYRADNGITVTLYLRRNEITLEEIRATLREALAELERPPTD